MKDKIFLDTALFIYFLEDNITYSNKIESFLNKCLQRNIELVTSSVTIMEFCTKPFELGNSKLVKEFREFLRDLNINIVSIDEEIAIEAAQLRGRYKSLKGMDSLQVASGVKHSCNIFVSNDKKLKQIIEIKVELIEEL